MDCSSSPDLATLSQVTSGALRALWFQWFNGPPPGRLSQDLLIRALAYRMQERQHGGLPAAIQQKLQLLAEPSKTQAMHAVIDAPRLTPGTHVIREWGNEMHQVTVERTGLVYRGRRYRSLSEIARRITGTRWSGPVFFGLKSTSRDPS